MIMSNQFHLRLNEPDETDFFRNIEADPASPDFEFEQDNVDRVFTAMENLMRTPTLVAGAVMPDACPTGFDTIPVGGVAVAKNAIHPGYHSADICCSVMATNLGNGIDPQSVLDIAQTVTHFGKGGRKRSSGVFKYLCPELEARIQDSRLFNEADMKKARLQLGTQGDGNHFLFVGRNESDGATVLVTHHGSRGFGAGLFEKGRKIALNYREELCPDVDAPSAWIPADTQDGVDYWEALQIVRDWTKLNHEVIHRLVAEKTESPVFKHGVADEKTFWNEHNFVFRRKDEENGGGDLFYHAKGATPLDNEFLPDARDSLRLIPLNMSQPILVVKGEATETNLGFAPHGAGRNMTRTRHKQLMQETGRSVRQIFDRETENIDARFMAGGIDVSELPSAYKNADEVQRQMEKFGLGTIVDRILPYGCIMAGSKRRR